MNKPQIIERSGRRFVMLPLARYRALLEQAEMLDDIRAYDEFKAQDDGFYISTVVADAMLDDHSHPIRAWREHRGLTQQALAVAARISKPFLSQIEARKRVSSVATLRRLAAALRVPLDVLTEDD